MKIFRAIGAFFDFLRSPRNRAPMSIEMRRETDQARARLNDLGSAGGYSQNGQF